MIQSEKLAGGVGDEKPSDEEITGIVTSMADSIKSSAMASLTQSGGNVDANAFKNSPIEVLSYKTQVVAGTNYFAKVRIASMIFHVRIYKHFSGSLELTKVSAPKKESDPIAYFQ